jgi:hypothetical protein
MAKIAPPFHCPKCGTELTHIYDANTGSYTPNLCRNAECHQPKPSNGRSLFRGGK